MTKIGETITVGRHQETNYISVVKIVLILQGIPDACIKEYFSHLYRSSSWFLYSAGPSAANSAICEPPRDC